MGNGKYTNSSLDALHVCLEIHQTCDCQGISCSQLGIEIHPHFQNVSPEILLMALLQFCTTQTLDAKNKSNVLSGSLDLGQLVLRILYEQLHHIELVRCTHHWEI